MKQSLENRAILSGKYIVETGGTVRQTAKHFGISKSTVFKDVTERLLEFGYLNLYDRVAEVLKSNFDARALRGGMATKAKYERSKG